MTRSKGYLKATGAVLVTIGALVMLYLASALSIYVRVALAFAALIVSGLSIQKAMGLGGGYGFYMIGSRKGLKRIDQISNRYKKFWNAMAMWGMVMGFGLFSYPMMKGRIDVRMVAFGVLSLIFMTIFVQPYLAVAAQFISLPGMQVAASGGTPALQQGANLLSVMIISVTALFGFSGYVFISIFSNAALILIGIAQFLLSWISGAANVSTLQNQIPGVAPIIPGITLPLAAGIMSLIVLLVIHELSHGMLSRIAEVKLKSIGLLMFGIIPMGAYVEPDEKKVKRLGSVKQTWIFSSGVAANFIAAIVFFALLLLVLNYVVPYAYQYGIVVTGTRQGYPANGVLKTGMQVLQWNGQRIANVSSLVAAGALDRPNTTVSVWTDSGYFSFRAVPLPGNASRGVIGVELGYQPIIKTLYAKFVYFIFTLIAISMLLNFLVAVVNLLPVPGFDGWRIYKANIKSKRIVEFAAALIVAGLIINALPWLFYI